MPWVAIILAHGSWFQTYKRVSAIPSSCHDPARFNATIASRLALIFDLDPVIQFVKVPANFYSIWYIS